MVLTKLAKILVLHSAQRNKGFCSLENDENGGCHPSKMTICQKHRFDNPDKRDWENFFLRLEFLAQGFPKGGFCEGGISQ